MQLHNLVQEGVHLMQGLISQMHCCATCQSLDPCCVNLWTPDSCQGVQHCSGERWYVVASFHDPHAAALAQGQGQCCCLLAQHVVCAGLKLQPCQRVCPVCIIACSRFEKTRHGAHLHFDHRHQHDLCGSVCSSTQAPACLQTGVALIWALLKVLLPHADHFGVWARMDQLQEHLAGTVQVLCNSHKTHLHCTG